MESFVGLFISSQWEVERQDLQTWVSSGGGGGEGAVWEEEEGGLALNCQPDGQPSPVYLGRSYGITLQRQIDILLTKQTTPCCTQEAPFPFCVCVGLQSCVCRPLPFCVCIGGGAGAPCATTYADTHSHGRP